MEHLQVPAVPAYIHGAYHAMPRHSRIPRRLNRITVAFGPPLHPGECADEPDRDQRIERLVATLRQRVVELAKSC